MSTWFSVVAVFSALVYAVLGGVFLAFSDFTMRALDRVSEPTGVETMQAINRQVFRALFMPLFIGMAPASLLLIVHEIGWGAAPGSYMIIGAGLLYLLGCFISTASRNVPLNQALATMDSSNAETHHYWREVYRPRWTTWNSVRTVACLGASALVMFALVWPI